MLKTTLTAILAATCLMAIPASAQDYKLGELAIVNPHVRATPPKAPVSAGYMTIQNTGSKPDRLTGGSAMFAGKVEIHEMKIDGDVMKMRRISDGLEIPAGGEVALKPGGYHMMFMKLNAQLKAGEKRKATLQFEKAGTIDIEFNVEELKPGSKMKHDSMDQSKAMDHSKTVDHSMNGSSN